MALYSLKMRASKQNCHISGAEKIITEEKICTDSTLLLQRALHHSKGSPDYINLKIESIDEHNIEYLPALPVKSISVDSATTGQKKILEILEQLNITNGKQIMSLFKHTYNMRGAMLLNVDTLERLEPDKQRGIRATYMDAEDSACPCDKNHFAEALVLATKVANTPHIIGEICVSDDPDYITGYVAAKDIGYVRISQLKSMGSPDGGRIFLYRGINKNVHECINYLEKQRVIVKNIPPLESTPSLLSQNNVLTKITADLQEIHKKNLYRKITKIDTVQAPHITCHNKDMILLASNNYLGLINHPNIKNAAIAALEEFGTGSGGSRLTTGTNPLHISLEKKLAQFKHFPAALLFNTGYMANVGVISALADKNTIIFSDELNHASIIDGCRLSKAKTIIYQHNNMADLENKIKLADTANGIIVSDAVFSMDGDVANLPQILSLAKRYGLLTIFDEAHSTGVIGAAGRGIVEYYNSSLKPDIIVGTMSKALASEGGFICADTLIIDYLKNKARSFIFSTSLSPAVIASSMEALNILENNPSLVKQLQSNTAYFCNCLQQNNITAASPSAIVPIVIGDEKKCSLIADNLFADNIYLSAIRYPTVKTGEARLRAAIMASHSHNDLSIAANKIASAINSIT